jgi:hypothetical protein
MSEQARHTSLEAAFFAAVPPRKAPLKRRILWWLLLNLATFKFVQTLIRKRARS